MVVSKKSLGVIVLLFIPCFAAGQNCVDSTTVRCWTKLRGQYNGQARQHSH